MDSKLYPTLEESQGHSFRLNKVNEIRKQFEKELEDRRKTINKYKKANTVIGWSSYGCFAVGAACEVSSFALYTTGIGVVIGIPIGIAGVIIGLMGIPINIGNNKIWKKLEKHEEIYILAISKLNSINDLISKALIDGQIDDKEYSTVLSEYDKYIELKNTIRKSFLKNNNHQKDDEELKKNLVEKGKELGKSEIIQKLLKSAK
jgi:hypothetical protein